MKWLDKFLHKPEVMPQPDVPLIWTTRGNVPEANLHLELRWSFVEGEYVKVEKIYTDPATGEVLKHGADAYSFKGVTGASTVGQVS